jgi:hypothetical protein
MCCGAGNRWFVLVGVCITVLIVIFQSLFHKPLKFLAHKVEKIVRVKFLKEDGFTVDELKKYGKVIGYSTKREGQYVVCSCNPSLFNLDASSEDIDKIFGESEKIMSVEFIHTAEK